MIKEASVPAKTAKSLSPKAAHKVAVKKVLTNNKAQARAGKAVAKLQAAGVKLSAKVAKLAAKIAV
jgi:hypothetical protein